MVQQTTDNSLDIGQWVKQHQLKRVNESKADEIRRKNKLYTKAGFTAVTDMMKAEIDMLTSIEDLKRKAPGAILVRPPPFNSYIYETNGWKLKRKISDRNIGSYTLKKITEKSGVVFTKRNDLILWEVDPSRYKGQVPENVLSATAKAIAQKLIPKVWVAAKTSEVHDIIDVHEPVTIDPVIVGYLPSFHYTPYADYPKKGYNERLQCDVVAVIGMWGKDLEEISSAFE